MAIYGPKRQERMPLQPLYDFCEAENLSHLSRMLGIDNSHIHRFKVDGIPIYSADKIACKKLGVHPGFIWKKEWVPE